MIELKQNLVVAQTAALLICYGFETRGQTIQRLTEQWLEKYQPNWLRLATIEALYLGRYKTVSVEQILNIWLRRGTPTYHFNHDFERLICRKLPRYLSNISLEQTQTQQSDRRSQSKSKTSKNLGDRVLSSPPSQPFKKEPTHSSWQNSHLKTLNPTVKSNLMVSVGKEQKRLSARELKDISQPPLKPRTTIDNKPKSQSSFTARSNCSTSNNARSVIHQFMPQPDFSEFYLKLKSVARQNR